MVLQYLAVTASAAKQSISATARKNMDCFAALAMTGIGHNLSRNSSPDERSDIRGHYNTNTALEIAAPVVGR